MGFCIRGRDRRRERGEEGIRPDAGEELRLSGLGVGRVRDSLGQKRLWQWQGAAKAEGVKLTGQCPDERELAEKVRGSDAGQLQLFYLQG